MALFQLKHMKRQVAEILRETGLLLDNSDVDMLQGIRNMCQAYKETRMVSRICSITVFVYSSWRIRHSLVH